MCLTRGKSFQEIIVNIRKLNVLCDNDEEIKINTRGFFEKRSLTLMS